MNIERLEELAKIIEKLPHTDYEAESGFSMDAYLHKCRTPSCIAGWAAQMYSPGGEGFIYDRARRALDLTDKQAEELFLPLNSGDLSGLTPAQAVSAIYSLIRTGQPIWNEEVRS